MDAYEATKVIDAFAEYQHCFAQQEILGFAVTHEEQELLLQTIVEDWRFVKTDEEAIGEVYFIPKKTLYRWYVSLNIKLARGRKSKLDECQLASLMSLLRLNGRWNIPPSRYVEFGQIFSLVKPTWNQHEHFFPFAHIISFMASSSSRMKIAGDILNSYNKAPWLELPSEQMVLKLIEDGLKNLPPRERYIITRREGLCGNTKMTLAQLGKKLSLTRERIRQIESKSWRRLRHPTYSRQFIAPLLFVIMCYEGSLLAQSEHMQRVILFLTKCINIPIAVFPDTAITILGASSQDMMITKNIWKHALDPVDIATWLQTSSGLSAYVNDLRILAERLAIHVRKKLTKTQKVYLALKSIGRRAHFTEIAESYHSLFPEDQDTEHNIHAKLTYNSYGVVWIGIKGTYALEEWGYERPSLTLFNTVIEIVERKYAETGAPVPYSVVLAELGKYRKVINPSSVVFATSRNPRLTQIEGDYFIPKPIEEFETDAAAEELDRILQEFEGQFGGHYSQGDT